MSGGLPMSLDARWPAVAIRLETHFDGRSLRCYSERASNLGAMVRAATAARLDRPALIDGGQTLTWRQVHALSASLAHGLAQQGLGAGDRAVVLMGNHAGFVIALLALVQLGAVAVPVSTREAPPGIAWILEQCQAKALLADAVQMQRLAEADLPLPAGLRVCLEDPSQPVTPMPGWLSGHAMLALPAWLTHAEPDEQATAVILYTSGTTGRPKGAMLTHLNLVHSVLHYRHALGLNADDRALLAVPASHVTGLMAIVLAIAGVG